MSTNFEKVCQFNKVFGVPHFDSKQETIEASLFKLRVDLCLEEVNELNEAFKTSNLIEVIDALVDEAYVIYGLASSFGINLDKEFKEFLKELYFKKTLGSNLSNFEIVKNLVVNDINLYYHIPEHPKLTRETGFILDEINKKVNTLKQLKDWNRYIKDVCFLLYFVYKAALVSGIPFDEAFDIVHNSNMSKLCISEEEAKATVENYKKNDDRYDTPSYREAEGYWVIYNKSTGKILKSMNYIPAKFNTLL